MNVEYIICKFLNKPNLLLLRDVSWLLVSQLYLVIYHENNFTCYCLQKCLFSLCPIKRLFSFQLFSSQIFSDHLSLDQLFGNMVEWEVFWGSSPATYLFVKITRENVSNPKRPFSVPSLEGLLWAKWSVWCSRNLAGTQEVKITIILV